MVYRIDIGSLRPPQFLADGGVRVDATFTRTGVFIYRDSSGKEFREYRPPEEVFDEESMQSFAALIVTDDHPPVMVTPANRDQYKCGRAGDTVKRDGSQMCGALIVDEPKLIAKMKAGKRDVSNGYACELDMTPGVSPEGERYDAIQRKIRGNHIAIVDTGRAGNARVRMDGVAEQVSASSNVSPKINTDNTQEIIQMEELQKKYGEALAACATEKARADAAAKRADDAEKLAKDNADKLAKAEGLLDASKAEVIAAKADADKVRKDSADAFAGAVKERVTVEKIAATCLGADAKIGDKLIADADVRDLKLAVIKKVDNADCDKDASGKPRADAYIDGRFEAAAARADKGAGALAAAAKVIEGNRADAAAVAAAGKTDDAEETARKQMIADGRDAWKKKENK
jgi:uncharacterized protein